MLESELKNIWDNSTKTAQISIETTKLAEELNTKVSGLQHKIRMRNIREISASVVGIIIFGYLLYEIPFPISKAACILAITWFAFVIFKFRRSKIKTAKHNLNVTLKKQLEQQKTMLMQQKNLLDSALYWYAIPPFIMNFIFILGLEDPSAYNWTNSIAESILPLSANLKIGTLAGLAIFYTFTFWVNKRAAKKDLRPIAEKIEIIQTQLTSSK